MRNLVKLVGIGLLALGLAACDNNDSKTAAEGSSQSASAQPVSLLDGKLSFNIPADMSDQSGKLGTQSNNMHVYSDPTGQKAVIVIVGNHSSDKLDVLAQRLEAEQRNRDPQLQVVTNKAIEVKGHALQQFDSVISSKGQTTYSSVILGNIDQQLLTMQITLPADNQQKAQAAAESIISTITIK